MQQNPAMELADVVLEKKAMKADDDQFLEEDDAIDTLGEGIDVIQDRVGKRQRRVRFCLTVSNYTHIPLSCITQRASTTSGTSLRSGRTFSM
jgi:hypothetical protein